MLQYGYSIFIEVSGLHQFPFKEQSASVRYAHCSHESIRLLLSVMRRLRERKLFHMLQVLCKSISVTIRDFVLHTLLAADLFLHSRREKGQMVIHCLIGVINSFISITFFDFILIIFIIAMNLLYKFNKIL